MLRKVKCDNIFVLAKSEDIANTESHIIMTLTESGASCINKSPLPPTGGGEEYGGGVTKVPDTHGEKAQGRLCSCRCNKSSHFSSVKAVAGTRLDQDVSMGNEFSLGISQ